MDGLQARPRRRAPPMLRPVDHATRPAKCVRQQSYGCRFPQCEKSAPFWTAAASDSEPEELGWSGHFQRLALHFQRPDDVLSQLEFRSDTGSPGTQEPQLSAPIHPLGQCTEGARVLRKEPSGHEFLAIGQQIAIAETQLSKSWFSWSNRASHRACRSAHSPCSV